MSSSRISEELESIVAGPVVDHADTCLLLTFPKSLVNKDHRPRWRVIELSSEVHEKNRRLTTAMIVDG